MKIFWLSHLVPYPPKGGVLQRSYHLLRELAATHEVYLLALIQEDLFKTCFADRDEGLREAHQHLSGFCEEVSFIPMTSEQGRLGRHGLALKSLFTRDPYSVNWTKAEEMNAAIRDLLARETPDAVHFDTIGLAEYLPLFDGQLFKVLDHHNIESDMMFRRAGLETNLLKKIYFFQEAVKLRNYEKRYCQKFDDNIVCSELDRQRLIDFLPGLMSTVVPNGVDVDYFLPTGLARKPRSLIFAGGMSWYPNVQAMKFFFEEVWPLLQSRCPDISMTVVGRSPPAWLRDLAASDGRIAVTGFVDDVRPYLEQAWAYVCPINDGGGTKLKILDALAMGKAIVAHPVACEGIDVVDGESIMFAETAGQYVEKLEKLFADPGLTEDIGNRGRRLIEEQYSYAGIGKVLRQVFSAADGQG